MRHREPILPAKAGIGMAICDKETDRRTPQLLHFVQDMVPFAMTIDKLIVFNDRASFASHDRFDIR